MEKTLTELAFERHGIKIGDRVKVVAKIPEDVHGNTMEWNSAMNRTIGKTFKVVSIDADDLTYLLENGHWYPALSVEKEYITEAVALPDYTAYVDHQGIKVGCQLIDRTTTLKLIQTAVTTGLVTTDDLRNIKDS